MHWTIRGAAFGRLRRAQSLLHTPAATSTNSWVCGQCHHRQRQSRLARKGLSRHRDGARVAIAVEDGDVEFDVQSYDTDELDKRYTEALRASRPAKLRFSKAHAETILEYADVGPDWHRDMAVRPRPSRPVRIATAWTEEIRRALIARDADRLLVAIEPAVNNSTYMHELRSTTFTAILDLLDPAVFLRHYQVVHYEIRSHMGTYIRDERLSSIMEGFVSIVIDFATARRNARGRLAVRDYELLLRLARATGSRRLADDLWEGLVTDKCQPSMTCIKHRIAATLWDQFYTCDRPLGKLRVAAQHFALHQKSADEKPEADRLQGNLKGASVGILAHVKDLLQDGTNAGLALDEEAYTLVMIAAAREGHLNIVRDILKLVWSIDDSLFEKRKSLAPNTNLRGDSPYAPSTRLMYSIAHCYCVNDQFEKALWMISSLSSTRGLEIPEGLWSGMYEWAFLLSYRHNEIYRPRDPLLPQSLPQETVSSLWISMRESRYALATNMPLYNRLIAHMRDRRMPATFETVLEEAQLCASNTYSWWSARLSHVELAQDEGLPQPFLLSLRRRFDIANVVRKRNVLFRKRWAKLTINLAQLPAAVSTSWKVRRLPQLLLAMEDLLPGVVSYYLSSGHVRFNPRTVEYVTANKETQARRNLRALAAASTRSSGAKAYWARHAISVEASDPVAIAEEMRRRNRQLSLLESRKDALYLSHGAMFARIRQGLPVVKTSNGDQSEPAFEIPNKPRYWADAIDQTIGRPKFQELFVPQPFYVEEQQASWTSEERPRERFDGFQDNQTRRRPAEHARADKDARSERRRRSKKGSFGSDGDLSEGLGAPISALTSS